MQEHAYVSLSYGRSSFVSYSFHNSYFLPELKDGVPGETLDVLGDEIQRQQHIDLQYVFILYVELIGLTNFSALGQGVFTMGIVNFTFLSLSDLTSRSGSIYSETIESIKEKIAQGRYPPGATETLRMQMQKVERNCLDCEIATVPTFFSAPSKISTSKVCFRSRNSSQTPPGKARSTSRSAASITASSREERQYASLSTDET